MLKKGFLVLFFLLPVIFAKGQEHRMYLNDDAQQVNKAKATSYIIYKKVSDTTWKMQQFDMRDTILEIGTYKDSALKIPNGKFFYYKKLLVTKLRTPFTMATEMDKLNHLLVSGEFKDGLRNGCWINYYPNGNPEFVKYYVNDKLTGPYKSYRYESNTILTEGNYLDGKAEGEWHLLNPIGEIIQITTFYRGEVSETHKLTPTYKPSQPTGEFYSFIEEKVKKMVDNDNLSIIIRCKVTARGQLTEPNIASTGLKKGFKKKMLDLISSSPAWTPGTKGNPGKPIEDFAAFVIKISNGEVTTENLNLDEIRTNKH